MSALESGESPFSIPPTPAFIAEMARRKEEEAREEKTAHLADIDLTQLTGDDEIMWRRIETGKNLPPLVEFNEYRERANASGAASRGRFSAYLSNLLLVKQARSGRDV